MALPQDEPLPSPDPGEPRGSHRDERDAHRQAGGPESEQRRTVGVARERRKLEADKDEDDTVQEEDEHVPEGTAGDPHVRPHDARRATADVETGRDRGEHARHAEELRRNVGRVRGQQRDRGLDRHVGETRADLRDRPADHEADHDAADDHDDEAAGRRQGERRGCRRRRREKRDAIDGQRGRVVEQGLAVEEGDDPARNRQTLQDRGRGDLVGRRDDSAERDSDRHGPDNNRHSFSPPPRAV